MYAHVFKYNRNHDKVGRFATGHGMKASERMQNVVQPTPSATTGVDADHVRALGVIHSGQGKRFVEPVRRGLLGGLASIFKTDAFYE
jgi:hypothetical protein